MPSSMSPSEAITKMWWSNGLRPAGASGSKRPRSRRAAMLWMPGRPAAPVTVGADVVERHPVSRQVELEIKGEAGVTARQDEPVPARPRGVGRVMPQNTLEEQVGGGSEAHGRAGMSRAGFLDSVHGEDPDQIDGPAVGPSIRARAAGWS